MSGRDMSHGTENISSEGAGVPAVSGTAEIVV